MLSSTEKIISGEEIIKLNSEWWNNPSKRNTKVRRYNHTKTKFPTNYLTTYSYDEIDIPLVSELNKYCISNDGQVSTCQGIDTSPDRNKVEHNFVFQREYLIILILNKQLVHFMKSFQPKRSCMIILEHANTKNTATLWTNDFSEKYKYTRSDDGKQYIWLTATQNESGIMTYPANSPLRPGDYQDLLGSGKDNLIQFDSNTFSEIDNFTIITLIRPEVGLSDDPEFVKEFKDSRLLLEVVNEFLTEREEDDISLMEEVINYFKSSDLDKTEHSISKEDYGCKRRKKPRSRSKKPRRSKKSRRR